MASLQGQGSGHISGHLHFHFHLYAICTLTFFPFIPPLVYFHFQIWPAALSPVETLAASSFLSLCKTLSEALWWVLAAAGRGCAAFGGKLERRQIHMFELLSTVCCSLLCILIVPLPLLLVKRIVSDWQQGGELLCGGTNQCQLADINNSQTGASKGVKNCFTNCGLGDLSSA